ncbi:MAG: glycosyltransferase [Nitrospirales bacterium]|nr:glycosyltransferase [Nitrospirales bacterium]
MKVLLHQNFISHYRRKLFNILCNKEDIKFTIVSDIKSDSIGIKAFHPQNGDLRWMWCQTAKIGERFFWHPSLLSLIQKEKPDAVIAQGNPYILSTWILLIWGRFVRRPVFLWTHGLLGQEAGLKGFIRLTFYRLSSALLLYGDHAKELLLNAGIDSRRMFVIYNSLDSEAQQRYLTEVKHSNITEFQSSISFRDGERVVVFSGRLQSNKKLTVLLDAIAILRRRERIVHIAFIGEGEERIVLMEQAERLNIASQVHFFGECYDERFIATVFLSSNLSVIPSGAGLSVMHALGYGVPVLLHDRPEMHFPEWEAVREGETGFFYRFGDTRDMADKMEYALFSIPKNNKMREACLAMIHGRYNATAHAAAIIHVVKQIVQQRK